MGALITGLAFLLAGALVYAYNTESHDSKITFRDLLGMESVTEVQTVTILLGLGVFFLGLGAVRWLTQQQVRQDAEDSGGEEPAAEPGSDALGPP